MISHGIFFLAFLELKWSEVIPLNNGMPHVIFSAQEFININLTR